MEAIDVEEEDMMVNFDIVRLFVRDPVSEAHQVIDNLLANDDTLKTQTTLLPADVVSLTKLWLTTTHLLQVRR